MCVTGTTTSDSGPTDQTIPHQLQYRTAALACLHEAGHAVAAATSGARVVEMELYLDSKRPYGRTTVERNSDYQRQVTAMGGFAVERRLWENGRIVGPDGQKLSERDMLHEAANNSDIDRESYYGADFRQADGLWPRELDVSFMTRARDLGNQIDMDTVERLAVALLAKRKLNAKQVEAILQTP